MKKIQRNMLVLVLLQGIDILLMVVFSNMVSPQAAAIFFIAIPLYAIADINVWMIVKKNSILADKNWELACIKDQEALVQRYEKNRHHWKQELIQTKESLNFLLLQVSEELDAIKRRGDKHEPVQIQHLLSDIKTTVDSTKEIYYCSHILSNIILCEKVQEATEKKIRIDLNIFVPEELGLTGNEWCSIWCNLLDNAIEACELVPPEHRYISVKSSVVNENFVIKIENTVAKRHRRGKERKRTGKIMALV